MSRAGSGPSSPDADLAHVLEPHLSPTALGAAPVLLAVSGGSDSLALLHAAARLAPAGGLRVATVDHGLRTEARAEAEAVGRLASALGLAHRILFWPPPHPTSGLQAAARAARYRLLAAHARSEGADRVFTAHTRDDQAETVLLRLSAGSGPAGLAGMRPERSLAAGVRLVRPFLSLPKSTLTAYCRAHGLVPVQDPANSDPRFARARLRAVLPLLAAEGLTPQRLRRLAERLGRDAAALDAAAAAALAGATLASAPGTLTLDGKRLRTEPEAIVLRVVDRALAALAPAAISGANLRLERLVLDALLPALAAGTPLRRTLRGILVSLDRQGLLRLAPAPPRRGSAGPVRAAGDT